MGLSACGRGQGGSLISVLPSLALFFYQNVLIPGVVNWVEPLVIFESLISQRLVEIQTFTLIIFPKELEGAWLSE